MPKQIQQTITGATVEPRKPDPAWIADLKRRVISCPVSTEFKFNRDEVIELLGGLDACVNPIRNT